MKIKLICTLLIFSFLVSCKQRNGVEKEIVSVSILPQKKMVEEIAGDIYTVNVMITPGAGHGDYEPSPLRIQNLANSKLYFAIGNIDFELQWLEKFADMNPEMKIVDLSENQDLIESDCMHEEVAEADEHHDEKEHEHSAACAVNGYDPHIWMSVDNMKLVSKQICAALVELNPSKKAIFEANLAKYQAKLEAVDRKLLQQLTPYKGKTFLIFHPALTYFAKDYGLSQQSIEINGKEPSGAHLKEIIEAARNANVEVVLIQQEYDQRNGSLVAKEIGAKVVQINPMQEDCCDEMLKMGDIFEQVWKK